MPAIMAARGEVGKRKGGFASVLEASCGYRHPGESRDDEEGQNSAQSRNLAIHPPDTKAAREVALPRRLIV